MDKGTEEVTNFVTKILRTYRASKSPNPFRRVVAALLIYSQIFQIALAAAPSTVPQRSFAYSNSSTSPVNYSPTGAWNNFSLTNQQLGLKGLLSWRATYSDLTGTFFNAQHVLPMGKNLH